MTIMSRDLTAEELAALRAFATDYGRKWKSVLATEYWPNARLWRDAKGNNYQGSLLHGLRNDLGPYWLANFKFSDHGL
jgi:hypothetical protein